MKLWTITLAHCLPDILKFSLKRFRETTTEQSELVIVDHHWPKDYWETRRLVLAAAEFYGAKLMSPYRNLGGHGGLSWALKELPIEDNDLVCIYDPDSNPRTKGWDTAMLDVLRADTSTAALFLMQGGALAAPNRVWRDETIAGHAVSYPTPYSVTNVAIVRASFYLECGMTVGGRRPFYGYVEDWMSEAAKRLSVRMGYMKDFWEDNHPIAHDEAYTRWKFAHAHHNTFMGNFAEFLAKEQT